MIDITLLLVDDHPVVRDGLRGMFAAAPGFTVLGEASSGVETSDSLRPNSSPPSYPPTRRTRSVPYKRSRS